MWDLDWRWHSGVGKKGLAQRYREMGIEKRDLDGCRQMSKDRELGEVLGNKLGEGATLGDTLGAFNASVGGTETGKILDG